MKPCPDTFPFPLVALDETASTNQYLSQLCNQLQESVAELTTVTAEFQTAGKGQRGNTWEAEEGKNLLFSFVLYPSFLEARRQFILSQIVSLAIKEELSRWSDEITIKWPNDIYCHGLKLGSTFTQVASPPDRHGDVAVIFSVGVNLSVPADRLPTPESTSLRMHVAPLPPTAELIDMIAARLVASLRTRLEAFVQMPLIQSSRLRSEMHHVCWMMGRQIDAQLIDGRTIAGKVVSLNDDASISVRTASGETERLSTGDIGLMV